jgi:hypothetical protein
MPTSSRHRARPRPTAPGTVEVATISGYAEGANLRITGTVHGAAVGMLTTVLRTHLRVGRRYLRVDLGAAQLDEAAVRCLAEAADAATALGGALVIERAAPRTVRAIEAVRRTPVRV